MTFDINKLEIDDNGKYHVTDAKGNPQYLDADESIPVTITLISPGTKKAAKAQFERDEARSARVLGSMAGKKSKRTEDDEIRERAKFLADVTVSLDGFEYPGGAEALYRNLKLGHIADGVEKFFNDRGNFTADSAMNSPNTSGTLPG
jgi:hypothetical protein